MPTGGRGWGDASGELRRDAPVLPLLLKVARRPLPVIYAHSPGDAARPHRHGHPMLADSQQRNLEHNKPSGSGRSSLYRLAAVRSLVRRETTSRWH
jgi:hypothetical protein